MQWLQAAVQAIGGFFDAVFSAVFNGSGTPAQDPVGSDHDDYHLRQLMSSDADGDDDDEHTDPADPFAPLNEEHRFEDDPSRYDEL